VYVASTAAQYITPFDDVRMPALAVTEYTGPGAVQLAASKVPPMGTRATVMAW
jgi:hypothetical protein